MGRVHCVSPLLYETGRIPFTLSMDNGRSFPRSGSWLAGEPHFAAPGLGTKLHAPQALVAPWGLPQCESVRTWPAHWVPPLWLNQSFGRPAQPRGLGSCSSCSCPMVSRQEPAQREWGLQGSPSKVGPAFVLSHHRGGLGDTMAPMRLPYFVLGRPPQLSEPLGPLPWALGVQGPHSPPLPLPSSPQQSVRDREEPAGK